MADHVVDVNIASGGFAGEVADADRAAGGIDRDSPAFDVNPSIDQEELALNIDDNSGTLDFDLAMSVREYFRLNHTEAKSIISQVKKAMNDWEKTAKQIGISSGEIELMHTAFRN